MDLPALSAEIKRQIDEKSAGTPDEPRWRLGASEIGEECLRRTWYKFRWFDFEVVNGRLRRLFQRGHEEETRIAGLLQSIGFTVLAHDPATGKQWRNSTLYGHYGGSSDGKAYHGSFAGEALSCQPEYKTHSLKSFNDLVKHGVKKSKPKHYIQMSCYASWNNFKLGLYFPVCKDNDDIQPELVEIDPEVALKAERVAEAIINAKEPPPKINENSAFFVCKTCFFRPVCHLGKEPARNCRSCRFATPTTNGDAEWTCLKWNAVIPREAAPLGCGEWQRIL